jgi:N-acetylmuramoyl-L-alanine amidase
VIFTTVAHAATLSVRGEVATIVRNASVEIDARESVEYVSLHDLARQLGVGFEALAGRVQLDLGGRTAWIHLDTADVDASTGPFVLSNRLLRDGDEVFIAVDDVQTLFSGAFGLSLTQERFEVDPNGSRSVLVRDIESPEEAAGTVDAAPPPVGEKVEVVVLDPGHGGADEGAVTVEGLAEKNLALAIAQRVKAALEAQLAVKVLLTRSDDTALTEAQRVQFSQRASSNLYVSLHIGGAPNNRVHGVGIFCNEVRPGLPQSSADPASHRLAGAVQHALAASTDITVQPVRDLPLRLLSRLGETPAIIVEAGYLTNSAEAALLAQEAYQQKLAEAIAAGISAYAKEQEGLR